MSIMSCIACLNLWFGFNECTQVLLSVTFHAVAITSCSAFSLSYIGGASCWQINVGNLLLFIYDICPVNQRDYSCASGWNIYAHGVMKEV